MRKPILFALTAIAVLGSCTGNSTTDNEPAISAVAPVFSATIDSEDGAANGENEASNSEDNTANGPLHAVVVPGSATGKMKVNWESGDQVRMDFIDNDNVPRGKTYVSAPLASDLTKSTLTIASDQSFEANIVMLDWACYPATLWDQGFPAEQTYQGVNQVRYAPMFYYNSEYQTVPLPESLTFRNAAALLKITVSNTSTAARTVKTVSVESSNKKMNGSIVYPTGDVSLTIAGNSTGTNKLTLNCGAGVSIPAGGSSVFYIIVPPTTYGKLTFTVTYTDNTTTVKSTKDNANITIERNKVYPIAIQ